MDVHAGGDCCGGNAHAAKAETSRAENAETSYGVNAETSHAGVNPLHVDTPFDSSVNAKNSSGCCGDSKPGHKHKHGHNHSHSGREPLPGSTNVFSTVIGDEVVVSAQESIAHQEHHKKVQTTVLLDNLGIAASTLCLIHCMAMPFLVALLPFLGLQFLEGEVAHRVIALFVFAFAIFAIGPGYMQHRKKQVLIATIFGLSLVAGALLIAGPMFGEQYELPFITTGNLILVITHLRNRKLCQCIH